MAGLKRELIDETLDEVVVRYLDRAVAKWWNDRRSPEDVYLFCGWFWIHKDQESGPFRTRSAALRDAYYRFVIHDKVPRVWQTDTARPANPQRKSRATRIYRETRAAV